MKLNLHHIRQEYSKQQLRVNTMAEDPLVQLRRWLDQAIRSNVNEPTAMNLSTVSSEGKPAARIVLLKEVNTRGLVFFSNYTSRKGKHLQHNPFAAVTFFWPELERQVRVEGRVEKIAAKESDDYFESRPYKSRIGAWASKQSQIMPHPSSLLRAFFCLRIKHPWSIPRPDFWGGYLLLPERIEFWQGRPSRLHDRVEYYLENSTWYTRRLYP